MMFKLFKKEFNFFRESISKILKSVDHIDHAKINIQLSTLISDYRYAIDPNIYSKLLSMREHTPKVYALFLYTCIPISLRSWTCESDWDSTKGGIISAYIKCIDSIIQTSSSEYSSMFLCKDDVNLNYIVLSPNHYTIFENDIVLEYDIYLKHILSTIQVNTEEEVLSSTHAKYKISSFEESQSITLFLEDLRFDTNCILSTIKSYSEESVYYKNLSSFKLAFQICHTINEEIVNIMDTIFTKLSDLYNVIEKLHPELYSLYLEKEYSAEYIRNYISLMHSNLHVDLKPLIRIKDEVFGLIEIIPAIIGTITFLQNYFIEALAFFHQSIDRNKNIVFFYGTDYTIAVVVDDIFVAMVPCIDIMQDIIIRCRELGDMYGLYMYFETLPTEEFFMNKITKCRYNKVYLSYVLGSKVQESVFTRFIFHKVTWRVLRITSVFAILCYIVNWYAIFQGVVLTDVIGLHIHFDPTVFKLTPSEYTSPYLFLKNHHSDNVIYQWMWDYYKNYIETFSIELQKSEEEKNFVPLFYTNPFKTQESIQQEEDVNRENEESREISLLYPSKKVEDVTEKQDNKEDLLEPKLSKEYISKLVCDYVGGERRSRITADSVLESKVSRDIKNIEVSIKKLDIIFSAFDRKIEKVALSKVKTEVEKVALSKVKTEVEKVALSKVKSEVEIKCIELKRLLKDFKTFEYKKNKEYADIIARLSILEDQVFIRQKKCENAEQRHCNIIAKPAKEAELQLMLCKIYHFNIRKLPHRNSFFYQVLPYLFSKKVIEFICAEFEGVSWDFFSTIYWNPCIFRKLKNYKSVVIKTEIFVILTPHSKVSKLPTRRKYLFLGQKYLKTCFVFQTISEGFHIFYLYNSDCAVKSSLKVVGKSLIVPILPKYGSDLSDLIYKYNMHDGHRGYKKKK